MSNIPSHPDLAQYSFVCDELNGMTLECFFEYEEEEIGSIEPMSGLKLEPDYPELWNLLHVYLPDGLDIGVMKVSHELAMTEELAISKMSYVMADAMMKAREA